ncbi:MAG: 3-oxoacyl-ACP reductase [Planctomycetes bacterium RBG_13_63_9]|nr:MAG: 3-oxoacyl-ACP reductase [Planctomycetes bacterium RBG_13_63_9]
MDLHLTDKVALVTGGRRGLGRAICLALAAEGAKVAVNYRRDPQAADAVVDEIARACGVEAMAVFGDVAQEADVAEMFDSIEQKFSRVDVLVNNAAVCPTCQVKDLSEPQWSHTLQVNLTGTFLTSREMVRRLISAGRPGRIVNVSSQAAFRGSTTGHAPYDASKGGIVSLTVSLAREVAGHGIAVNAVAPGMMLTEMTAAALQADPRKYIDRIPLRRVGNTEEIANVVAFLASERASYMTGATVDVSGGMLMR